MRQHISTVSLRSANKICTLDQFEDTGLGRDDINRVADVIESAGVGELSKFAETVRVQLEGDLSDREFRQYITKCHSDLTRKLLAQAGCEGVAS